MGIPKMYDLTGKRFDKLVVSQLPPPNTFGV